MQYRQITDYAYLGKGRKYWTLAIGNPFCLGFFKIPLEIREEEIIERAVMDQRKEKRRFTKQFPDVKWEPEARI